MYSATSNTAKDLKNDANELAGSVKSDLNTAANQAGKKVRSFINSASDEITHATDTVTTQVRQNPVQSSVIALGVGFLLGSLFRR